MPRLHIGKTTYDASIERMLAVYEGGHRVVVSFSGGKDSGVCLEICIMAAQIAGKLPVEVVMRDEEIMLPGTFEYCERVAQREEVKFHWVYAGQPVINVFNRKNPYFWVFDDRVDPDKWMRKPPEYAYRIPEQNIEELIDHKKFPPPEGKGLYVVVGLRTVESISRLMGLMSSKSYVTKADKHGVRKCRPIYDWTDGDVWLAHKQNNWDYNTAYDAMHRFGYSRNQVRIAPPTMATITVKRDLKLARKAFPKWFNSLSQRLDGVRTAAMFGLRAVQPQRNFGETWEAVYIRECIEKAPQWIAERSQIMMDTNLKYHNAHSDLPFPDVSMCPRCKTLASWKQMAYAMYMGDPFSQKANVLPYMEPEFFRQGAGYWGGKPTW